MQRLYFIDNRLFIKSETAGEEDDEFLFYSGKTAHSFSITHACQSDDGDVLSMDISGQCRIWKNINSHVDVRLPKNISIASITALGLETMEKRWCVLIALGNTLQLHRITQGVPSFDPLLSLSFEELPSIVSIEVIKRRLTVTSSDKNKVTMERLTFL